MGIAGGLLGGGCGWVFFGGLVATPTESDTPTIASTCSSDKYTLVSALLRGSGVAFGKVRFVHVSTTNSIEAMVDAGMERSESFASKQHHAHRKLNQAIPRHSIHRTS